MAYRFVTQTIGFVFIASTVVTTCKHVVATCKHCDTLCKHCVATCKHCGHLLSLSYHTIIVFRTLVHREGSTMMAVDL